MVSILLKEFSNSDIEWLLATGSLLDLTAGTTLIHPRQPLETCYVLLSGELAVTLTSEGQTSSSQTVPAQAAGLRNWEFTRLCSGELAGAIPFLEAFLPNAMLESLTSTRILALPRSTLAQKLNDDTSFAAHFYRVSSILLVQRLAQLSRQIGCNVATLTQMPLREASTVFAELQDSDLDWLIAVGRIQQLAAETPLIQSGRPVDELHLVLEGAVTLNLIENADSLECLVLNHASGTEQELARLSRGDLVGETLLINAFPANVTVKTLRETQVLSIPKWRLAAKLLHDTSFAARFYRVLAVLLANKQQAIIQRLGYNTNGNEMSNHLLTQVALAEARFEWMLKRIQTQMNSGEIIQW